jgi:creatinine amidohydrolase
MGHVLKVTFVCLFALQALSLNAAAKGVLLENLSWPQAEHVLTPQSVVLIALGAEAKEHGPHLQLNNDWLMAEYFKQRVLATADVIVAPTINYSFYPAFREYPGSTSLRLETARDMIVDIVLSLAKFGPRRFYILNTGIATIRPLNLAREELVKSGIELRFTDLKRFEDLEKKVRKSGGTHADEIETSMMLYIAPKTVNMKKAVKDLNENKPGGLTRDPKKQGTYSPTGTWGDPTLASREKGRVIVDGMVEGILREIEELRRAPIPETGNDQKK